ncbi:MAG: succinate dehydrogenase cytochrome b subunit [Propionibacteriaceae bacterium]
MATISLTPAQQATRSTVALKVLMAVTGLILIGYLIAHMYGNLKVFAGAEAFNEYAHHLRTLGEPIFPYSGVLWVIRVILIVSVIGHMYAAFTLWSRARTARGGVRRYRSNKARRGVQRTYASFTLRWGGLVIVLFVIYHLMHLTWNVVHPGGAAADPYSRVVNGFQIWSVVLIYTVAVIAVGLHVRHGTWSALTTLGANTSSLARRRLNVLAYAVAGLLTVGFLLPPFAILFGLVS